MLGTKIPKHKTISLNKELIEYKDVDKVYIPLANGNDTDVTVLVKKGEYVYKGDMIGKTKGDFRIPIISSVSGVVVDFEEMSHASGKIVKCVVIENDKNDNYRDNKEIKKDISDYTKEEFIEILKESGIVGMGGGSFPTYVKYETDKKIKTLIVNAVECEPYITADHTILKNKCEEILETIDAIMEINDIDEAIIAIKKSNIELKKCLDDFLGTYLNIRVSTVPDLYPMGWERNLVRYIKKEQYEHVPIECGIVVNNVSTIYAIYEALKYRKPLTERIVTISGNLAQEPINVLVPIGTLVKDVIDSVVGIKDSNHVLLIAGGPMMGKTVDDKLVVSANLSSVLLLKELTNDELVNCLRCGKCVEVCPAKLSPVLIKDNCDDKEKLKQLLPNRCIACGLCSYICPSKILVREYVSKAKETLRK